MNPFITQIQALARGATGVVRTALRRGALRGAALLIAGLGAAFLVFACYFGLRFLLGPGLAALTLGATLLALSAGVWRMARSAEPTNPPLAMATPQEPPAATPSRPAEAATMAVFTVAFLLGRQIAGHLTGRCGRSNRS